MSSGKVMMWCVKIKEPKYKTLGFCLESAAINALPKPGHEVCERGFIPNYYLGKKDDGN